LDRSARLRSGVLAWLVRAAATAGRADNDVAADRQRRHAGGGGGGAVQYLATIPRPEIGSGSDAATLYAACRLVRGFGLDAADAESLLWKWAGDRPGWTRDWVARKVAHAQRYGTEAIGGLR